MTSSENVQKLIKLAAEHPNLPIIPMVDGEIIGDDLLNNFRRWMGSFGSVEIEEYVLYDECFIEDREEFKENFYNMNDEELNRKFNYSPFSNNEKALNALEKYLDEVADRAFKTAIIVHIDAPDAEEFEEGVE